MRRPLPIGGNLRPYFPDSRIVDLSNRYARLVPPAPQVSRQCLIIWEHKKRPGNRRLLARVRKRFGVEVDPASRSGILNRPMAMSKDRRVRFGYILIPDGSGTCR